MIRLSFILILSYFLLSNGYSYSKKIIVSHKVHKPTIDLYRENGIKFPEIVFKQSILETGNFTSNIYINNNNCFGMKYNNRGYAYCERNGHACYESIIYSIRDYAEWQSIMMNNHERLFRKKIKSEEDYYFFLERLVVGNKVYSYAEDKDYVKKLKLLQ